VKLTEINRFSGQSPAWFHKPNSPRGRGSDSVARLVTCAQGDLANGRAAKRRAAGWQLWVSVWLALYVSFWLELDNPFWAGYAAATVS